ncbi:MAG: LptE family protein, partial [Nitrospinota bacterium]|nr:LptE family protein [Nitrospinota bacterium]
MRNNKKRNWSLLFAISCSLFYGCGYHLVGTGKNLPVHLKSISIPVFKNTSSQPEIHRELTSAILQSFISDGRLKVTKKENADLVMDGTLSYYNKRAVSFNSQDLVADFIIEIEVELEVLDQVKNKIFLKEKLRNQWDYKSNSDIADTET